MIPYIYPSRPTHLPRRCYIPERERIAEDARHRCRVCEQSDGGATCDECKDVICRECDGGGQEFVKATHVLPDGYPLCDKCAAQLEFEP